MNKPIDYSQARVSRLTDRASPSTPTLTDLLRTFYYSFRYVDHVGSNTVFKSNVRIRRAKGSFLSLGADCVVHEGVQFLLTLPSPRVSIGNSVFIGMYSTIASKGSIEIGNFSIFAPRCYILDHEHGFSGGDLILNQKSKVMKTVIGCDCYFGTGTVITGGVTVGDGAVVAANSVVVRDIPPMEIWGGVPAKFIRMRQ